MIRFGWRGDDGGVLRLPSRITGFEKEQDRMYARLDTGARWRIMRPLGRLHWAVRAWA